MVSILPHASRSFYALSNTVSSPRDAYTYILGPTHYRFERLVPILTTNNHYYLGNFTLLTRHMSVPLPNDNFVILASRKGARQPLFFRTMLTYQRSSSVWLSFNAVLSTLACLGLAHKETDARDNGHHYPSFVTCSTPNAIGTILSPRRYCGLTVDTTQY